MISDCLNSGPLNALTSYLVEGSGYLLLLPIRYDLTQGLFYSGSFREGEVRARAKICALLDYVGHGFTWCNVSQVTLLGLELTECNVSLSYIPAHSLNETQRSCAMLCLSVILHPSEAGSADPRDHSALNLSV